MSVIPEFRISDHIDFYVKQNSEDFLVDNPQFLSIPGASTSDGIPINSSGSSFYKIFSFSDFMKHFRLIKSDHEELADPTEITLECRALKKFLPYDGFYPATRTVQIAGQWSSSYGPYISAGGNHFLPPTAPPLATVLDLQCAAAMGQALGAKRVGTLGCHSKRL